MVFGHYSNCIPAVANAVPEIQHLEIEEGAIACGLNAAPDRQFPFFIACNYSAGRQTVEAAFSSLKTNRLADRRGAD